MSLFLTSAELEIANLRNLRKQPRRDFFLRPEHGGLGIKPFSRQLKNDKNGSFNSRSRNALRHQSIVKKFSYCPLFIHLFANGLQWNEENLPNCVLYRRRERKSLCVSVSSVQISTEGKKDQAIVLFPREKAIFSCYIRGNTQKSKLGEKTRVWSLLSTLHSLC